MKVRLIEKQPQVEQTREITVTQTDFLIGRGADCDLRLPDSSISRHHCIIRVSPDEATLVDLGSSNGSFLNGQRVRSQATLKSGDEIQVGNCGFLVDLGDLTWTRPDQAGADAGAQTIRMRNPTPRLGEASPTRIHGTPPPDAGATS